MASPTQPTSPATLSPAIHLVLARHAESLHNRDGDKVSIDSGLTELGWRQAHALAGWLAVRYRPDLLLSSTLLRAQQTAEVLAGQLRLPLTLQEGLEEAEFQYWDELPYRWEKPLDPWRDRWQPDSDISPLYASFRARVYDSFADFLSRVPPDRPDATIVAVTHGGVIGTVLRGLFGGHHVAVFTANTGVTQLTWELNHWRLAFHNSTAHLEPPASNRASAAGTVSPAASPWTNGENAAAILKQSQRVAATAPASVPAPGEGELRELVRLAGPNGDERVLDVATGAGAVALAFAPHVSSVVGVDLSPAMLERAEAARSASGLNNVHYRLGEIGVLPLEESAYDIVACHNLLHYVLDLPALLTLFRRVLTPSGRLVMDELVGSDDPVRRATLNAIMLRRDAGINGVLSVGEIEAAVKSAGFRIIKSERYTVSREIDEWLARAAADEATRSAVRSMIEAGLDADSAGLNARRGRDGNIQLMESRIRLLGEAQAGPG